MVSFCIFASESREKPSSTGLWCQLHRIAQQSNTLLELIRSDLPVRLGGFLPTSHHVQQGVSSVFVFTTGEGCNCIGSAALDLPVMNLYAAVGAMFTDVQSVISDSTNPPGYLQSLSIFNNSIMVVSFMSVLMRYTCSTTARKIWLTV